MTVDRDSIVRTIVAKIEDGPILNNDWATWRRIKRPFKLAGLVITVQGSELADVLITGPLILKGGRLSETQTDEVRLYPKDVDRAPRWLQTLILDTASNVKGANYPDPASTLSEPIGIMG